MLTTKHKLSVLGAITAALVTVTTFGLVARSEITAQEASKIIEGCAAYAKGKGQSHAIAVYDDGGHPVAVLRMDGNPPGATEFAMQKAAAVANWRFSTMEMGTAVKETPGFRDAPNVVTVPGGIPIFSSDGKQFVGTVGVSGEAPQDDLACAEAGVRAAGLSISRKPAN
jgi:glc operon protein GlcG